MDRSSSTGFNKARGDLDGRINMDDDKKKIKRSGAIQCLSFCVCLVEGFCAGEDNGCKLI